ncbi:MAG: CHRD domain-containing protein [Gammaproteobacteria bacterium]|nr:CHRD domain-containing protein [Gammaproteobacteria bacterium]MBI5619045.1 CHRD domain-containing protein [Gammaproteobacteria bacterium]
MKNELRICALTLALAASASVAAHEMVFVTSLSGANESPSNASPGTGSATVTLDVDTMMMRVQADFSGLIGNTTASHIHCCTLVAGAGNAGVATVTPSFVGFPLGVEAGTYDHTYDMSVAAGYNAAFVTATGSVLNAWTTLLNGISDGKAYLNIHTSAVGSGEIRGFLTAAPSAVPLPAALPLFATALGVAGGLRRRYA